MRKFNLMAIFCLFAVIAFIGCSREPDTDLAEQEELSIGAVHNEGLDYVLARLREPSRNQQNQQ